MIARRQSSAQQQQRWNFDERRASIEYDFDVDVVSSFIECLTYVINCNFLSTANEKIVTEWSNTMEETRGTFVKMKESEIFLDVRIRKYRSLLDQQSVRLCSRCGIIKSTG
jgi:hypothetical protein